MTLMFLPAVESFPYAFLELRQPEILVQIWNRAHVVMFICGFGLESERVLPRPFLPPFFRVASTGDFVCLTCDCKMRHALLYSTLDFIPK